MIEEYHTLNRCYEQEVFPFDCYKRAKELGVMGLTIKGYGSPGLTTLEAAAICFEMCKRDSSFGGFFIVHNCVAMATINALGDEEQKTRLLTQGITFDRIMGFALTEPSVGSDASNIKTTATKTEGGWLLNGAKRWIGGALNGDIIVWAKNTEDEGRIQAFYVE